MKDSFAVELNEGFVLLHSGFCVLSTSQVGVGALPIAV